MASKQEGAKAGISIMPLSTFDPPAHLRDRLVGGMHVCLLPNLIDSS